MLKAIHAVFYADVLSVTPSSQVKWVLNEYGRGERVRESHTFRNGSDTLKVSGIVSVGNHRNNSLIDTLNPFSNYHRKAIIFLGLATRTRRLRHSPVIGGKMGSRVVLLSSLAGGGNLSFDGR